MSSFDYGSAEAWETAADILLPVGNHVCTIKDPGMSETSNGNPQIELRVENNLGSLRDWLVITPNTIGKVVQVFDAAGVQRPQEGEFDPESGRLTDRCVDRLHNKQVGVVVREEPDYKDPTRMRKRVSGYIDPVQLGTDIPADMSGLGANSGSVAAAADDRVPF